MSDQAEFWNTRFAKDGFMYGEKPNEFIKNNTHLFTPKADILCLAEGEGRNAIYLAKQGFAVTALDTSDIGLAKCALNAARSGLDVSLSCTDLEQWDASTTYDAIVASFMHLPEPLRTKTFKTAMDALRPEGYIVMEFFSKDQMRQGFPSGGPKDLDLLYSVEEVALVVTTPKTKVLHLEQEEDTLDEGWGHQGKASLIRLILQKKAD